MLLLLLFVDVSVVSRWSSSQLATVCDWAVFAVADALVFKLTNNNSRLLKRLAFPLYTCYIFPIIVIRSLLLFCARMLPFLSLSLSFGCAVHYSKHSMRLNVSCKIHVCCMCTNITIIMNNNWRRRDRKISRWKKC